jgi:2,3,4,5-tetrahydropyridine-2-carboxylate N-succinyltransferase
MGLQGGQEGSAEAEVLQQALAGAKVRLTVITSPVPHLLSRLARRQGSAEDTLAFVELLNGGDVRAAEKVRGAWQPQPYVIDGILNFFGVHDSRRMEDGYWDKVPLKTAGWSDADFAASGVRFAPGCRVRTGCYIGAGTVVMNQAFINIGAYIAGQGVMVDVSGRVASCAQIGKGVKFGAGSGIEGILEPAGRLPSIVEDQAKIGAMCEVSGIVGEGSVLASGVVMASGKKIYDEATGKVVPPLAIMVGETTYQVPVIPPYRLAVGGSLLNDGGKTATDAVILKPGDLRDGDTLRHFEKQGILYP